MRELDAVVATEVDLPPFRNFLELKLQLGVELSRILLLVSRTTGLACIHIIYLLYLIVSTTFFEFRGRHPA
jgi:hypothetical protein